MTAAGPAPRIKLKIQLMSGDVIAFGPGKADLLDAIDQAGSISAAARTLGLSYRRAWLLVDTMNHAWPDPLVITTVGGRTGARLTDAGRAVLADFRALVHACEEAAGDAGQRLMKRLDP